MKKLLIFTIAIICFLNIKVFAQTGYSEDFTNYPNFTSLSSTHAYWDSISGNYFVNTFDNETYQYWAYSPSFNIDENNDFTIKFDMLCENADWGTKPGVHFYSNAPTDINESSKTLSVRFVWTDTNPIKITISDASGNSYVSSANFANNMWYTVEINYYATVNKADLLVKETVSGTIFFQESNIDLILSDISYLGIGYYDVPNYGDEWSPIRIDNINIYKSTCLIADYPFNGNANEESGSNIFHNLTNYNAVFDSNNVVTGSHSIKFQQNALEQQWLESDSNIVFDLSQAFSIKGWFYWDGGEFWNINSSNNVSSYYAGLICQGYNGSGSCTAAGTKHWSVTLNNSDKTIRFQHHPNGCNVSNQETISDTNVFEANKWYMFTVTHDGGGKLKIYLNDSLVASRTDHQLTNAIYDTKLYVGARYNYYYSGTYPNYERKYLFSGYIDNIEIFDCILDSAEIDSIYLAEKPQQQTNPCLIADYPFNGNANDESGNGPNGTVNGATLTTDRFGNANSAYSFDGDWDYIEAGTVSDFNFLHDGTDFTISVWVKNDTNDINSYGILGNAIGGDYRGICLYVDGNDIKFFVGRTTPYPVVNAWWHNVILTNNSWNHIVVAFSNNEYNLYVNGVNVNMPFGLTNPNQTGDAYYTLKIGTKKTSPTYGWALADIDDLSFYNCALDPIQIDSLYHLGGWDADTCNGFAITSITTTDATCGSDNGTAEVVVTGGNTPFTYNWSNSDTLATADSLAAGMHYVQVTDSLGCFAMEYFTVNSTGGPVITVNGITNIMCNGDNTGAIDINVSGGVLPYDIHWSNGATSEDLNNIFAGNYQVMITDNNGCMASFDTSIVEPDILQATFTLTNPACMANDGEITVAVNGGTLNYNYTWNTGDSTNSITGLSAGTYTVTIADNNGCTFVDSIALTSSGGPVITLDSILIANCGGNDGAIYVSVTGGTQPYASYLWSDGTNTEDIENVAPGTYYLTVTDAAGCIAIFNNEIESVELLEQPICVVSVDTITGTNLIVWEKVQTTGVDHYNIYRESWYVGQYNLVGSVLYDDMSEFTDPDADPTMRSWRYKISAADACGNESVLSDNHKTIHLTTNQGIGSLYNLIWDHYEGFAYYTYYIYRHLNSTGWALIDSLPANLTTYTDSPPSQGGLWYIISINTPSNCIPTSTIKANGGPYSQSTSNMEDEGLAVNINNNYNDIKSVIYPNPTTGILYAKSEHEISMIRITNLLGQNLISVENKKEIDMSKLPVGMYLVKVYDKKNKLLFLKKVIKN